MTQTILLATANQHKLQEFRELFKGTYILQSTNDFPDFVMPPETSNQFEGNAMIKAKALFDHTGFITIADDSGICVDALSSAPGVLSARFAGVPSNDLANNNLLLEKLIGVTDRNAHFQCSIALIHFNGSYIFNGICEGTISTHMSGKGGFGYDSLFIPNGYSETFAELPLNVKNKISHRAKAYQELRSVLSEILK